MGRVSFKGCDDCPHGRNRETCTELCQEFLDFAQLPGEQSGRGIGYLHTDKYRIGGILGDLRGKAPDRVALICAAYYRLGWTQEQVARAFRCSQRNVSNVITKAAKSYA